LKINNRSIALESEQDFYCATQAAD